MASFELNSEVTGRGDSKQVSEYVLSNNKLQDAYRIHTEFVVDAVNADSVGDFLFAAKVLSAADLRELSDVSERTRKTRKLLILLHNGRHPKAFIKLHEAIGKDGTYGWLVKEIEDICATSKVPSTPTLTHVIRGGRQVVGVTSFHSRLFVLRHPSQQHVQVYDTKSFKHEKTIQVKGLSDDTSFSGLTSCVTNNCLYVSDYHKDFVYKVELDANNRLLNWNVDRRPTGLSVNAASNLLVACTRACKIQEYTADGLLVRELRLQSYRSELRPLHAKQMSSDQFVISCWNGKQPPNAMCDVVEVDRLGRVVVSYTSQLQSTSQQKFDGSGHLAVDENNTRILVSDCKNHRIVILNRTSNCARELNVTSVVGGVRRPSCLHFDASKNRLFVGECREQCRVLVLDNVI